MTFFYLNKHLVASLSLLVIDYVYISFISSHYHKVVKKITKDDMSFRYKPALLAYIVMLIGINYFIIKDIELISLKENLLKGFILGLTVYGTFDFTNAALFKDYDYKTILIDITWGILLHLLTVLINYKYVKLHISK